MKRFNFRLEKVLNWKQSAEDSAKNELGKVRGRINREVQKKNSFIEERRNTAVLVDRERHTLSGPELIRYEQYRDGLMKLIERQDRIILGIREEEKKAIGKYLAARREKRILETLKEKKREEYHAEQTRMEKKTINEIGTDRFIRARGGDGGVPEGRRHA